MEDKKINRIKQHLQRHKMAYAIVGSSAATVAVLKVTGYAFGPDVVQTFENSTDNIAMIVNRSKNVDVVIKYMNQRGYPAKPVRCLETLEEWASQAEAALAKGISSTNLSQHLNERQDSVNGLHFEHIIA